MASAIAFDAPDRVWALCALGLAACIWFSRVIRRTSNSKQLPYPPGPQPMPILGNYFDMPKEKPWLTFNDWAKVYGDVVSVSILGKRIVLLNSDKAVDDLLEKRSAIYSSRPHSTMLGELVGFNGLMNKMPYGERWRSSRRAMHPYMHPGGIKQWQEIQIREVHSFISRLRDDPDDVTKHIRHLAAAIIIGIVYGIPVPDKNSPYTTSVHNVVKLVAEVSIPGTFLVESIPLLKHVPSWLPGAGFKRRAISIKPDVDAVVNGPFGIAKNDMAEGGVNQCMVSQMLSKISPTDPQSLEKEMVVNDVASSAYIAGADTVVAATEWFFLAMATNPGVQRCAQSELDRVVGDLRLPAFSDMEDLPYIQSVVLEVLRWRPVGPLGGPRSTTEDDEYNGYFIPKGAVILGNVWSILHDPTKYPDPDLFRPERFLAVGADGSVSLDNSVRDPRTAAFGFGRRACPARYLAEQSLLAVVAFVLAVYTITPPVDETGNPDIPKTETVPGHVFHPAPAKFVFTVRSKEVEKLVQHRESNAD